MSLHPIFENPGETSLFDGIDTDDLAKVSSFFEPGSYEAGANIVLEDEEGDRMYIVTRGRVEVSIRTPLEDGALVESVVATQGVGAIFGEMELVDTQRRSATVTAVEDTETIELTNDSFYQIFLADPDIFRMLLMNLARELSRRLRKADRLLARPDS